MMACKLLRKCQKDEFPVSIILVMKHYVARIKMKWEIYMFIEFIQGYVNAQDIDNEL